MIHLRARERRRIQRKQLFLFEGADDLIRVVLVRNLLQFVEQHARWNARFQAGRAYILVLGLRAFVDRKAEASFEANQAQNTCGVVIQRVVAGGANFLAFQVGQAVCRVDE